MTPRLARLTKDLFARTAAGMKFDLDRTQAALEKLGRPEADLTIAHVAGTNGKGSTASMIASCVKASGRRCGLFTSPHLMRVNERIAIDGTPADDTLLADAFEQTIADSMPYLTFFEVLTVAAFLTFREANVDVAVIEVGLGGRLDATNAASRIAVSAITTVALDHTSVLGDTLPEIASEKAGILRTGTPLVTGRLESDALDAVAAIRAQRPGSWWALADDDRAAYPFKTIGVKSAPPGCRIELPIHPADGRPRKHIAIPSLGLRGPHQRDNAAVAAGVCSLLGLDEAPIAEGLADATWPGRFDRHLYRGRDVWLDGAHNPAGARALAEALRESGGKSARWHVVFGCLADKDAAALIAPLRDLTAAFHFAPVAIVSAKRRSATMSELGAHAQGIPYPTLAAAMAGACEAAAPEEGVVICGSLFLVGEALGIVSGRDTDDLVPL